MKPKQLMWPKGSSRIVIIFTSVYTAYAGREGVKGRCMLLKMLFMVHCDFKKGSRNQHVQSTLLVGREGS